MSDSKTAGTQPANGNTAKRVRTIEKRHGKSFMEVMCDVHDHVLGATPPEDLEPEGDSNVEVEMGDPEAQQTSETGSGG